jgi:hypothetical protein
LATIADKVTTETVDETVVEWEMSQLKRKLKVVICLVELVVEEEIRL